MQRGNANHGFDNNHAYLAYMLRFTNMEALFQDNISSIVSTVLTAFLRLDFLPCIRLFVSFVVKISNAVCGNTLQARSSLHVFITEHSAATKILCQVFHLHKAGNLLFMGTWSYVRGIFGK
jgi:hypothetical protein